MRQYFITTKNSQKDGFIWNMIGSMLMAFQSVIMLMILTREVGIIEAGIFTIAYANANLFLTIGKYGVRFFQVSDVNEEYKFSEYFTARCITTSLMITTSIIYIFYSSYVNSYDEQKTAVFIWMCLFKVPDAIEDVFCGLYQQRERLDIGAKILTIRMILTILVYAISIMILGNQLYALIMTTIFTTIILLIFLKWTYPLFENGSLIDKKNVGRLLKVCAPVFLGTFLAFYIGNAPKYAIDSQLSDEIQACYGFVAMPVFVIGLLNSFIFNPMLYTISIFWNNHNVKEFIKIIVRQICVIFIITSICLIGAYFLGVQVLSLLYSSNLVDYKAELLILLVGGGFLGLSGLLSALITIIRVQQYLIYIYGFVAILALVFSNPIVEKGGVLGAAILYTGLMGILCTGFLLLLFIEIRKAIKYS